MPTSAQRRQRMTAVRVAARRLASKVSGLVWNRSGERSPASLAHLGGRSPLVDKQSRTGRRRDPCSAHRSSGRTAVTSLGVKQFTGQREATAGEPVGTEPHAARLPTQTRASARCAGRPACMSCGRLCAMRCLWCPVFPAERDFGWRDAAHNQRPSLRLEVARLRVDTQIGGSADVVSVVSGLCSGPSPP
jgi:hypothetical protein